MGFNKVAGDLLPASELNSFYSSAGLYGASSTGTDAYAITVTPVPNDYDAGDTYAFKADVGNTGPATLNVNSLGTKTIKKFGSFDLETADITAGQIVTVKYDGTNFQIASEARPTPFFQQSVAITPIDITNGGFASGSSNDGSVIYEVHDQSTLARYERDSSTGSFLLAHSVAMSSFSISSFDYGGILQIGNYIYVFNATTNIACKRFDAADLTNQTSITVPSVAVGSVVVAWTDGISAYLVSDSTGTTSRKWTLSGTTFSANSTGTVTSSTFDRAKTTTFFDGLNAYVVCNESGSNQINIQKLTNILGTSFTTTTKKLYKLGASTEAHCYAAIIDNSRMYIGKALDVSNATVVGAAVINLIPVTKP